MNVFIYNYVTDDWYMEELKNIKGYSKSRMIFTKDHKYYMNHFNILQLWQSEVMTFYNLSPPQRQKLKKISFMRKKDIFKMNIY